MIGRDGAPNGVGHGAEQFGLMVGDVAIGENRRGAGVEQLLFHHGDGAVEAVERGIDAVEGDGGQFRSPTDGMFLQGVIGGCTS